MKSEMSQELNQITKESLFIALMQLMEKKDFNSISITEIAEKAGVSRMAYYRNYQSKEDILTQYFDDIFAEFVSKILKREIRDIYTGYFQFFREHKDLIEVLIKADMTYILNNKFLSYVDQLSKTIFSAFLKEINPYELYYAAAGLQQLLVKWVDGGCQESDEEMAAVLKKISSYTTITKAFM